MVAFSLEAVSLLFQNNNNNGILCSRLLALKETKMLALGSTFSKQAATIQTTTMICPSANALTLVLPRPLHNTPEP
jgi:hypothetical protein